jgi:hypothetical protein
MFAGDTLRATLALVGQLLEDRAQSIEIVVIGGGALLLANLNQRPTKDLDALAIVVDGEYHLARPLPTALLAAVSDAAAVLGLAPDWLNPGPTDQLSVGLPDGFKDRTSTARFGGLTVQFAGRFDQICLKLYAAADDAPGSKHVADLRQLDPTVAELQRAGTWVKQQDLSVEFHRFVDAVIEEARARR